MNHWDNRVVDTNGVIILLGGLWASLLPIVWYFAIKRRRWLPGLIYSLPVLWFAGGYIATL